MRAKTLRMALRLVGPLLLVIVLVRLDDKPALWAALGGAKLSWLLGAALLNGVNIQLEVWRWQSL